MEHAHCVQRERNETMTCKRCEGARDIMRKLLEAVDSFDDGICFWCQNKLEDQTQHEDDCVGEAARAWIQREP